MSCRAPPEETQVGPQPLKTRFCVLKANRTCTNLCNLNQLTAALQENLLIKSILVLQFHLTLKTFALLFHLSRSVSGWYFKHLKITNKNRSKSYICNSKTFYMFFILSIMCKI